MIKDTKKFINKIKKLTTDYPKWMKLFSEQLVATIEKNVVLKDDGTTYVVTGDIPAMWLRDSSAQLRPYLFFAKESPAIQRLLKGLIERQFQMIAIDPYANAFNEDFNGRCYQKDLTEMSPIVWERKYEIDSLAYPIQLAYLYYKNTGDTSHFNQTFIDGVKKILAVWMTEQDHTESPYTFQRFDERPEDTLTHDGKGNPVQYTGMTWSGFRPSDDANEYHYFVPGNMFAAVVLNYLEEIFADIIPDPKQAERAKNLREAIEKGIKEHAIVKNAAGEEIYAYEVDGFGNALIMDDANVPSLLAAPYLGFCDFEDPLYQRTRATVLSDENPYYYSGRETAGIGSPHTPENYIWHISLAVEGLTHPDQKVKEQILNLLVETDGNTGALHEGFDKDDATQFTREWFSWPNMLFCELMLNYFGYELKV